MLAMLGSTTFTRAIFGRPKVPEGSEANDARRNEYRRKSPDKATATPSDELGDGFEDDFEDDFEDPE